MAVCIAACVLQVAGGLAAVGPFGMTGVAAVSAASVMLQSLAAAILVRRQTGISAMPIAVDLRRRPVRLGPG
jgi:hypothetical protein